MSSLSRVTIVGNGRMGNALAAALRDAGVAVEGPLGRGAAAAGAEVVLLCVPDREIAAASAALAPAAIVGHVSASADLELLRPHERFMMHPLLSVVGAGARFDGALAAIDASTPRALDTARTIARAIGLRTREIPPAQRALYHAAASAASNFLITVEGMAEQLAHHVGLERHALVPLVHATVANWAASGARAALTGPIARGDEATAARQREAVSASAPELLPLWDALADGTRALAARHASS